MSGDMELETLFVRIKCMADELSQTQVTKQIKEMAKNIETSIYEALGNISPSLDTAQIKKDLRALSTSVETTVTSLNAIAKINFQITSSGVGGDISKIQANTGAFLETVERSALGEGGSLAQNLKKMQQALNESAPASESFTSFAARITRMYQRLKGVGDVPSFGAFADRVANAARQLSSSITSSTYIGLQEFGQTALRTYMDLQGIGSIVGLGKFQTDLMAVAATAKNAVPDLQALAAAVRNVKAANFGSTFKNLQNDIKVFISNMKQVLPALQQMGSQPQLKAFATDVDHAAGALRRLNMELAKYIAYMGHVHRQASMGTTAAAANNAINATAPPMAPFGFNPIRRILSGITGMVTGLGVGYLGFEMIRQVTALDEEMTRAMARGAPNITSDVLNLSRRVATGPVELAQAYRGLTEAGYGTAAAIEALAVVEQFAFVNTMDAAVATNHLTTMQRLLGLTSSDVARNTANLREMGDMISYALPQSRMTAEAFTTGLQRLTPHLTNVNHGLGDSIALLTALGRVDPGTAVNRAEALITTLTSQFIRSSTPPGGGPRTGGRFDPVGMHTRGFQPGMGVHPLHDQIDAVRQAGQEWERLGVRVFDSNQQFVGVARTIALIDQATRGGTDEQRTRDIMNLLPGGFRGTAAKALMELLASREALEQFHVTAQQTAGTMQKLATIRLMSVSSQFKVLQNNLIAVGSEMMRFVLPALIIAVDLFKSLVDTWWELGTAGRLFVVGLIFVGLSLAALRFIIPTLIVMFRIFFWDTLVAGALAAQSIFMSLRLSLLFQGLWYVIGFLLTPVVWLLNVALSAMSLLWALITGKMSAAAAIWSLLVLMSNLMTVALVPLTAITWLYTWSKAALATAYSWLGVKILLAFISLMSMSAAQVIATIKTMLLKAATWLWNAALTVTVSLLTLGIGVVIAFAVALIALVAAVGLLGVTLAVVAYAAMWAFLMGVQLIINSIHYLLNLTRATDWSGFWGGFQQGAAGAFWVTVGFFDNLQDNLTRLATWMDTNWPILLENFSTITQRVMIRLGNNLDTLWARTAVGFMNTLNLAIAAYNATLGGALGRIEPFRIDDTGSGIGGRARHPMQSLTDGVMRGLREVGPLELNLSVSEETRTMIENMFSQLRSVGERSADFAESAGRIGTSFKEISLRRFVLEGTMTGEDLDRRAVNAAERSAANLDIIANAIMQWGAGSGLALTPPAEPFGP